MRSKALGILLAVCVGCGSSGGDGPGGTTTIQGFMVQEMGVILAAMPRLQQLVPALLYESARDDAGITFELDDSPGADPDTYNFSIPLDSNGDGQTDTTISGSMVLTADPTEGGQLISGFSAQVDVQVQSDTASFQANLRLFFDFNGGFRVAGMGTYNDPANETSVTSTITEENALHIRTADAEAPDKQPNACAYAIDGIIGIDATRSGASYVAQWEFDPTSVDIAVTDAALTPEGGEAAELEDSTFRVTDCPGQSGSAQDWAGTWEFDWYCIPDHTGSSELTITVIDSNTIEIVNESPPGSGETTTYRATLDPDNPRIVRGEFEGTDEDGTFDESFTWVMDPDKQSFTQEAEFFYTAGDLQGVSGYCGGEATKDN